MRTQFTLNPVVQKKSLLPLCQAIGDLAIMVEKNQTFAIHN
jgi:hypothetical protein